MADGAERATGWTVPLVIGSGALAPLVVRLMLLAELGLTPVLGDLRGLAFDLAISFIVVALALYCLRWKRWGRFCGAGLLVAWCVINFANYEHIRELGSIARFSSVGYLVDPTFLFGSGLAISHPWVFLVVAVGSCLPVLTVPPTTRLGKPVAYGLLVVALLTVGAVIPRDHRLPQWRTANLIAAELRSLVERGGGADPRSSRAAMRIGADLGGVTVIGDSPRASNVLLIILEGVSGAYLPSLAERHGVSHPIVMRELDAIARDGLAWSTFINHQRQTNRGEYAILCGDYPKLGPGEPKMTELIGAGDLECLPAVLRDQSFRTVYLQAAPMSFMMKDQFMPQAGFETAIGDDYFETSYRRNNWGVDDRAFFEQGLAIVEELQRQTEPWFLTLLTVGTHHPFNVPDDFESRYEPGSDGWAMDYLDRAVSAYLRELERAGMMRDTLVLITSDESRERRLRQDDMTSLLAQAWGLLIALTPTGENGVIDEPFMQLDLPLSVLDYLGIDNSTGGFGGRSVFRGYDRKRQLLWGNGHLRLVAGLSASGELAVCDRRFENCFGTRLDGQTVFSPEVAFSSVDPLELEWLRRGVEASGEISRDTTAARSIALLAPGTTPLHSDTPRQLIAAGQFLSIPERTLTEVEIEMRLTGRAGGRVWFEHDLILSRRQEYLRTSDLEVGQTVRIRYSFLADVAFQGVELRIRADEISGPGLAIETIVARVSLTPSDQPESRYGFTEHEFAIDGAD